jgi:hypothetical protein
VCRVADIFRFPNLMWIGKVQEEGWKEINGKNNLIKEESE